MEESVIYGMEVDFGVMVFAELDGAARDASQMRMVQDERHARAKQEALACARDVQTHIDRERLEKESPPPVERPRRELVPQISRGKPLWGLALTG